MADELPSEPAAGPDGPTRSAPAGVPRRARSARGHWLLGVAVLLVISVGTVVTYRTTSLPGLPGSHSTTARPLAAAPTTGEPPPSTARPVYRLPDNPLETAHLHLAPLTCELPPYPADFGGRNAFYTAAKACLDSVWQPVLTAAGLPFTPANLVLFGAEVGTPCGQGDEAEGAFYCDGSATIYISPEKFTKVENVPDSQFGVFLAIMAHEYGHHVQDLSGMFAEAGDQRDKAGPKSPAGLEISRRTELQANCFAGMFFAAVDGRGSVSAKVVRQASSDMARRGDLKQGPADHGSLAHSALWFQRGLQANDTGSCDTWTAPPGEVS